MLETLLFGISEAKTKFRDPHKIVVDPKRFIDLGIVRELKEEVVIGSGTIYANHS